MRRLVLLLSIALATPAHARPAPEPEPEVQEDPLSLVALLIRDGHWDRAAQVLDAIDPKAETLDKPRHRTLLGLVALRRDDKELAIAAFTDAKALGAGDPLIDLYLAQALLDLDRAPEAYAAVAGAGAAALAMPQSWLLRARAAQAAGLDDEAWAALIEGGERFPERAHDFAVRQVMLLVDLGLYRGAVEIGRDLLAEATDDPGPWIAVGESLRRAGQAAEAATLLEEARLRFPADPSIPVRLAGALVAAQRPLAAAVLLEQEALMHPELALEAAECFRRAGALGKALSLNTRVPSSRDRYQQRLGLLLEAEDWPRASMLEPRLRREGLLDNDEIAYALGYAWFRLGDHEAALRLLRGIADPSTFERATALREAMARCDADPLGCS
jgi:tetratricopeptide (TPR) repeat protein